jgi:hypothetical protein
MIPLIDISTTPVKSEMVDANLLISTIKEASLSLKQIAQRSSFIEAIASHDAQNLERLISEIQERARLFEEILNRNAIISAAASIDNLANADDVSVAFHFAMSGSEIDWTLAEKVLEKNSSLKDAIVRIHDEDENWDVRYEPVGDYSVYIWENNNFDINILKLLKEVDYWRLRKSLELIFDVKTQRYVTISVDIFDSLALVLLAEDERNWIYLIAKNKENGIDSGILRLVNAFIYSPELILRIVEIMQYFTEGHNEENSINFLNALNILKALVKTLTEQIGNNDITKRCIELIEKIHKAWIL